MQHNRMDLRFQGPGIYTWESHSKRLKTDLGYCQTCEMLLDAIQRMIYEFGDDLDLDGRVCRIGVGSDDQN